MVIENEKYHKTSFFTSSIVKFDLCLRSPIIRLIFNMHSFVKQIPASSIQQILQFKVTDVKSIIGSYYGEYKKTLKYFLDPWYQQLYHTVRHHLGSHVDHYVLYHKFHVLVRSDYCHLAEYLKQQFLYSYLLIADEIPYAIVWYHYSLPGRVQHSECGCVPVFNTK